MQVRLSSVLALTFCCLYLSVADRLRTLIRDWYDAFRSVLEKNAREARNIHRQQKGLLPQGNEEGERPQARRDEEEERPQALPSIKGDLSLSLSLYEK